MKSYRQFAVFMMATILIAFNVGFFYISFFLYPAQRIYEKIKSRIEKRKERVDAQELILWQLTVQAFDKGNDIILFFPGKRETVKG